MTKSIIEKPPPEGHPESSTLGHLSHVHAILGDALGGTRDILVSSLLARDDPDRNRRLTTFMSSIRIVRQGIEDMHAELVGPNADQVAIKRKVKEVEDRLRDSIRAYEEMAPSAAPSPASQTRTDEGPAPSTAPSPASQTRTELARLTGLGMDLGRSPEPHDPDFYSGLPGGEV